MFGTPLRQSLKPSDGKTARFAARRLRSRLPNQLDYGDSSPSRHAKIPKNEDSISRHRRVTCLLGEAGDESVHSNSVQTNSKPSRNETGEHPKDK